MFGSVQPGVLQKLLGNGDDDNGNWARFIFVNQPLAASTMTADGGKFDLQPMLTWLYEQISLLPATEYRFSRDAFELFCCAYNYFEQKRTEIGAHPAMSHVWGKSEGRICKLAINLHCIKYVMLQQKPPLVIDREIVKAAIALTNFYALQVQSIYTTLGDEQSLSPNLAKVIEVADRKGDFISAREVIHSLSSSVKKGLSSSTVRGWFKVLVDLGKGVVQGAGRLLKFKSVTDCGTNVGSDGNTLESLTINDLSSIVTDVTSVTDLNEKPNPVNSNEKPLPPIDSVESKNPPLTEPPPTEKNHNISNNAHNGNNQDETQLGSEVEDVTDCPNNPGNNKSSTNNTRPIPTPKYEIGQKIDRYNTVHDYWHTNITILDRVYQSIEWVYRLDDCWQNWIYERYLRPTIVGENSETQS